MCKLEKVTDETLLKQWHSLLLQFDFFPLIMARVQHTSVPYELTTMAMELEQMAKTEAK